MQITKGRKIMRRSKRDTQAEKFPIQGILDSGPEAFAELARTYSPRLYSISLKYLKNHTDAEDNVQNALFKAYRKMHQFEGRARVSSWLIRITINEALMAIRRRRQENLTREAASPELDGERNQGLNVADGSPGQEREYIAKELVAKALHGLPSSLVDAFLRHKGDGWLQRDLARETGISVTALKSRLFSARGRMQHRLQELPEPCRNSNERGRLSLVPKP